MIDNIHYFVIVKTYIVQNYAECHKSVNDKMSAYIILGGFSYEKVTFTVRSDFGTRCMRQW